MEIIAKVKCIVPRQKFGPLRGLKNTVLAVGKASTAFWPRPPLDPLVFALHLILVQQHVPCYFSRFSKVRHWL